MAQESESIQAAVLRQLNRDQYAQVNALLDQILEMDPQAGQAWLSQQTNVDIAVSAAVRQLMAVSQVNKADPLFEEPPKITGQTNRSDSPFAKGQTIGPYSLESRIGVGGMGEVWKALPSNQLLKRAVALKLTKAGVLDTLLLERFSFERDSLARLNHPNIARLYDAGSDNKQPYLALELVEGIPINLYCQKNKLNLRDRVMLFTQVLDAVQYAHTNLLIHRDIKPSNIMVTAEGQVKLVDFGIAKQSVALDSLNHPTIDATEFTQVGQRVYTPRYASPEQFRGERVSTLTDVYSLGVVLYELLTDLSPYVAGQTKTDEKTPFVIDVTQFDKPVTKPSQSAMTQQFCDTLSASKRVVTRMLSDGLDGVVLTAMAKEPQRRYSSARAFSDDLVAWSKGEPVRALPPTKWYFFRKFCVRHPLGLGLGSLAITAVLSSALIASVQANKATQAAQKTGQVTQFLIDMLNVNSGRRVSSLAAQANRQTTAEQLLIAAAKKLKLDSALPADMQANLLGVVGDLTHELQMNDQAIDLREKQIALLNSTADKVSALLNLSDTLFQAGKTKENDATLKRARELVGVNPAPDQALVASRLQMREGRQFDLAGKFAESTPLLLQAAQKLKSFEPPHLDWIEAQRTYIEGLRLSDPKACISNFETFISELEQRFGANSVELIPNLRAFAATLARQYETDRAKQIFAKLDAIHLANPNYDPAGALISLSEQAVMLRNLGEFALSTPLLERSLKGFDQLGLQDHPVEPASVRLAFASALMTEWDFQNAEKNLKQLDHIWRDVSSRPPSLATVLEVRALGSAALQDWENGRRYFAEARQLREKSLGPGHPTVLINDARSIFLEALAGNSQESLRRYEVVFNTPIPASGGLPAMLVADAKASALPALVAMQLWPRVISDTQQLIALPTKTPIEKLRRLAVHRQRTIAFTQLKDFASAQVSADQASQLLGELGANVSTPERVLVALSKWQLAKASSNDLKLREQLKMQFEQERSQLKGESVVLKKMLELS